MRADAKDTASAKNTGRFRRWRRRVANLLILAGLLVLLYPVGTWGYAWYQQRALTQQLEESHPLLAGNVGRLFDQGLTRVTGTGVGGGLTSLRQEKGDLIQQAREAEAARQTRQFRDQATSFAQELAGKSGTPMGKIQIPSIGVDAVIIQGTGTADLREGPGHWPETPLPGMGGNFVVSGHRTTYGAPFFKLDKLGEGDVIRVVLPYAAVEYRVTRSLIVSPQDVEAVRQRNVEELSLTTCHPIYSAAKRLVVQASLSGFRLLPQTEVGGTAPSAG